MKYYYLPLLLIALLFVSCAEKSLMDEDHSDVPVGKFVNISCQISTQASTRAPLTEKESSVGHFYVFVVDKDGNVLHAINRYVETSDDLSFTCEAIEQTKFPIKMRVLANFANFGVSGGSWRLYRGNNAVSIEQVMGVKTDKEINEWSITQKNVYQDKDLPKIGELIIPIEKAGKPQSLRIKNAVAKVDVVNPLSLTELILTMRIKSYPLNGGTSTAFDNDAVNAPNKMVFAMPGANIPIYLLPGAGNKTTQNTGLEYQIVDTDKRISMALPNVMQLNTLYVRTLSATGFEVSVPNVPNLNEGVVLTDFSGGFEVEVNTASSYTLTIESEKNWLREEPTVKKVDNKTIHRFVYSEQNLISEANIIIRERKGDFCQTIPVAYKPREGEVKMILESKKLHPINFVIIGDGFRPIDNKVDGLYDQTVKDIVEGFFNFSPFLQYKEYFSVYQVYANSVDEGADFDGNQPELKNTIFDAKFGPSWIKRLLGMGNKAKMNEYANKAKVIGPRHLLLAIANTQVHGGSAGAYAVISRTTNAKMIALHEIGHLFSLADEYVDQAYANANNITSEGARNKPNVDITNDRTKVKWKHFLGRPGYETENVVPGGFYLQEGVWRPKWVSIMHSMSGGFNAISRETIVKKIKSWSGEEYSFEEFLEKDKIGLSRSTLFTDPPVEPDMMPVPLEYYVKPSDMPEVRSRNWDIR